MLGYLQKPAVQMALFFVAVAGGGAFFYMQDQKPAASPSAPQGTKTPPKGMGQAAATTVKVERTEVKSDETTESVKLEKLSLPPSKPAAPSLIRQEPPKKEEKKKKPPEFPNLVQMSERSKPRPFVPKEPGVFAPRGTLIKAALVITLESNAVGTPVLGMVIEDVYFGGHLIVPAGTQVQGSAFANSRFRDRIDVRGSFTFIWTDGSEYVINGIALDHQPLSDGTFSLTDGSPGIKGRILKTDEYAELKLLVTQALQGVMNNSQTQFQSIYGLVPENTNRNAALGGGASGAQAYAGLLAKKLEKDMEYVQVPAGTSFYIYTLDVFEPELRSVAGLRQGNKPKTSLDEQMSDHETVVSQFQMSQAEAESHLQKAREAAEAEAKAQAQQEREERTKALFAPVSPPAPDQPAESGGSGPTSSVAPGSVPQLDSGEHSGDREGEVPLLRSPGDNTRMISGVAAAPSAEHRLLPYAAVSDSLVATASPALAQTMSLEQQLYRGLITREQADMELQVLSERSQIFPQR